MQKGRYHQRQICTGFSALERDSFIIKLGCICIEMLMQSYFLTQQ